MTLSIDDFKRFSDKVESLQRKADKAQGALEQGMDELKEMCGCDTVEEAKEVAAERMEEANKLEEKFKKAEEKFTTKWGDKLRL